MIALPERCAIYRLVPGGSGEMQKVYGGVPCLIQPVSSYERVPEYARSSTHVAFLPRRMTRLVFTQDQLRTGRRSDRSGAVDAFIFTVSGVRSYRQGLRHVEAFLQETMSSGPAA